MGNMLPCEIDSCTVPWHWHLRGHDAKGALQGERVPPLIRVRQRGAEVNKHNMLARLGANHHVVSFDVKVHDALGVNGTQGCTVCNTGP